MKIIRRGFTLIEVALFLAITGALFVGIALGVQNSMFQQRYNDSVQSFADFLRSAYSETSNVQNPTGDGRSDKAIYGRLIVFGESQTLTGDSNSNNKAIYAYDVVGNISSSPLSGDTLEALKQLQVNVVNGEAFYGNVEEYKPRWMASIQSNAQDSQQDFVGAILIARNPSSGTTFTFVKKDSTLNINSDISSFKLYDNLTNFKNEQVDFCVNPNGNQPSDARRDVRIIANARNASGVEIIDMDATGENGNLCNGS